jgi:hypothetical protein
MKHTKRRLNDSTAHCEGCRAPLSGGRQAQAAPSGSASRGWVMSGWVPPPSTEGLR